MSQTLLQELSNSDIDWLMTTGKRQRVERNYLLIKAGQQICAFYWLIDGSLMISSPQDRDNTLNRAFAVLENQPTLEREIIELQNGDFIGEELLFNTTVASNNIRTQRPSDLLIISPQKLKAKLKQDISFAARFYRGISHLLTERLLTLIPQLRMTRLNSSLTQSREVLFTFGRLHDSDIDWMISNGNCQKIPAGKMLFQEGRPAETLYLLLNGLVKVTLCETAENPLDRAFAALGTTINPHSGQEIATLQSGTFIGELPFAETRLASTSVETVEKSLVLAISISSLKLKLQQDLGFAARFEEVVASLAIERFRDMINRLGYGRRFYSKSQTLEPSFYYEDELDLDSLDQLNLAGTRFQWMLDRLQLLSNNNWQQEKKLATTKITN